MDHVVDVEEVRHRRRAVVLRVLVEIHREVEAQLGPAARARVEVRRIVGVLVEVGVDVVALRGDELGTDRLVDVMPAERRGDRVRRVGHQRAAGVVGALVRPREYPVARAVEHRRRRSGQERGLEGRRQLLPLARALQVRLEVGDAVVRGPVVLGEQRAGLGVDGGVPEVRVLGVVDHGAPGKPQAAGGRLPAERGLDRLARDPAARQDRRLRLGAGAAHHAQLRRPLELEPERGLVHRRGGVDALRVRGDGREAHRCAAREQDRSVVGHVDGDLAPEDLEVPEALVDVHVRDAEAGGLVDARELQVREVGALDPELLRVLAEVGARDLARVRLRRGGGCCTPGDRKRGDEDRDWSTQLRRHRLPLHCDCEAAPQPPLRPTLRDYEFVLSRTITMVLRFLNTSLVNCSALRAPLGRFWKACTGWPATSNPSSSRSRRSTP